MTTQTNVDVEITKENFTKINNEITKELMEIVEGVGKSISLSESKKRQLEIGKIQKKLTEFMKKMYP